MPPALHSLPPKAAALALRLERFVRRELGLEPAGIRLVAALSGGVDSTALVRLLAALAPRWGAAVAAAHLDHGLRPDSADDAAFCRALCVDLGMALHERRADVAELAAASGVGLEEAGRRARYAFLEDVRRAEAADFIITAHTLDDLAEDQLLRLIRGAGWPELAGMPGLDADRRLLRPLLLTPKAELLGFLALAGSPWREDPSNQDPRFTRNRVRHALLPLLTAENPGYLRAAGRLWRLGRLDRQWLGATLPSPIRLEGGALLLPSAALGPLPPALRLRAMKAALEALGPGQPRFDGLMDLERAVAAGAVGVTVQFPGNKTARLAAAGLVFDAPRDRDG